MKYKLEIIADSVSELILLARLTVDDLNNDPIFLKKIKNKKINSVFFTKFANILTIKDKKLDNQEQDNAKSISK